VLIQLGLLAQRQCTKVRLMLCDNAWLAARFEKRLIVLVVENIASSKEHLQAVDEGQEQHALEAALVQGIRRPVGGGHQHHPQLPQLAAQNCRQI
jgi:hypothetical protein